MHKFRKPSVFVLVLLLLSGPCLASDFDLWFLDKTLRIDYYQTGNAQEDIYSMDELIEEPSWAGPVNQLTDPFDYGKYKVMVYDSLSGILVFSRGFSTLFGEWIDTPEAKIISKSFQESFCMPYPKKSVRIDFFSRNKQNRWLKKFSFFINPENYFIRKSARYNFPVFKVCGPDNPHHSLDIVMIPDGYTASEMEKFKKDCQRFSAYLLQCSPYLPFVDHISVRGVEAPSSESGTDFPGLGIWKNTLVETRFYTFDSERYLMTFENKTLRSVAGLAPYDQIVILVNSDHYGGGGIYNFYSVSSSDNVYSDYVFTHEFGHAFAGLADEYYDSEVSVQDFYPLQTEPWEPNITTLVHFENKWKSLLPDSIPVPTPASQPYMKCTGVFEGGGYVNKGVYRPSVDCSMRSIKYNRFCEVCRKAITDMLSFYTR